MPTLKTAPALISALLFLFLSSPQGASQEEPPRSVQIMLRMLTEQRARMPLAAYELLEESGHRAAFEAMIETARDPLQPLLLRARCVRHLAGFVTDPSLAGQLLRELTGLALDAPEQGLRLLCVDELAETGDDSVVYLEAIVDHGTDPEVRARALGHHADSSPDQEWYVSLLTGVDRQRRSDTFDRDMQLVGATLRLAAFDEVVEVLELETLRGLVDAKDIDLRLDALEELVRRDAEDAAGLSKKRYETTALPLRERLASGALHVRYADEAFVEDLIEAGSAEEVDPRSRELVGRAAATALTIPLVGDLQRAMARGSLGERTVAATALRGDDSNRFRKNLVRLLEDEDAGLRILAAEELANWVGDPEALEGLLARLEEGPELGEGGRILRSATAVAAGDPTWDDRLREYLEHPAADVRGEALELLAERVGEDALVPLLEGALASNDWTRVSKGVELLVAERSPESVKAMIDSLEVLDGRDQRMVADGLWRVSGLQLGLRPSAWKGWWSEVGEGFEPVDPTETALLLEERRRQEESVGTDATFFGIRVESHRVCFIVDISGSMDELTSWGRTDRDDGGVTRDTRLDVAKAELSAALDSLLPGTLFNVIVFSSDAEAWSNRLQAADESTIRKAKAFVDRQLAKGGTNLYSALRMAFEDQGLDSLVVLSDGEPSMGELRDSDAILGAIERWNGGRGVRIDCIAIGVQLELLERLAERCFGECVSLR